MLAIMSFLLPNLSVVFQINNGCVFVCVDINLPNILWSNDETGLIYSSLSGVRIYCIPECPAFLNFLQLNEVRNISDTILD